MASNQKNSIAESTESALSDHFRLSSYETRAYISLLKQGKQSPKQISSMAGIPLPRVYDTLESLMAKGFCLKRDDTYYSPIPPRQALKGRSSQFEQQFSVEQRKRKMAEEDLARTLELLVPESPEGKKDGGEISILKGFNSIANKFSELLERSSETILIAKRAVEAKEIFIPILLEFAESKKKPSRPFVKGREKKSRGDWSIRIIIPKDALVTKEEVEQARKAGVEIKRSESILFDLMITDQNDVIIGVPDPLSDEINHAIAIWVNNSSFASSTRLSVEELWEHAAEI